MSKFNILLVDDDQINRILIKAMLAHYPNLIASIIEAENGQKALEIIETNPNINLILLDIFMPIMDGKEFLKLFRSKKKYSNIPVIVLTTDDSKKSEILNLGADNILIKPIKEEELIKSIKYWQIES